MSDIEIRVAGRTGRITLNRPAALNALTWQMVREIDAALDAWKGDPQVSMIVIDGVGERAFCSGGDISEMYRTGRAGDYAYGRAFWAEEYRMNRKIYRFAKPVVSLLQGYTMGGGVGVGCHGSHRIVGDTSQIAMPECGIGLVPDVGGTLLLARAPGHLGEYLGTTGARMGPGDAIRAGFADIYVPEAAWPDLVDELERTGTPDPVESASKAAPEGELASRQADLDGIFGSGSWHEIVGALRRSDAPAAEEAWSMARRNSPLSMACAVELIRRARAKDSIEAALTMEHRFTARAMEHADFLEGIRAAIVDKDKSPRWRHDDPASVSEEDVTRMLAPLGSQELTWEDA